MCVCVAAGVVAFVAVIVVVVLVICLHSIGAIVEIDDATHQIVSSQFSKELSSLELEDNTPEYLHPSKFIKTMLQ